MEHHHPRLSKISPLLMSSYIFLVHIHTLSLSYVGHDSFIHVWHGSLLCGTCLILMRHMTHSYLWHDSFIQRTESWHRLYRWYFYVRVHILVHTLHLCLFALCAHPHLDDCVHTMCSVVKIWVTPTYIMCRQGMGDTHTLTTGCTLCMGDGWHPCLDDTRSVHIHILTTHAR